MNIMPYLYMITLYIAGLLMTTLNQVSS